MADNTNEELIDSPANTPSKNPSEEIILTKDTNTINSNQETENMEVHAQELHKAPGHGWKHYLFEFLMLFLAVFCGFLAENQREHMVERDREKIFIQTFIEDLRADTADINRVLIIRQQKKERMDSLMLLLSSGQIKGHEKELYYFGRTLIRTANFNTNDRTIT